MRKHGALAELPGSGTVCSIPILDRDEIRGVLTLEQHPGGSFDATLRRICEATMLMVAPVLYLKWRDQRWVGSKVWESVGNTARSLRQPGNDGRKVAAAAAALLALFVCFGSGQYRVAARAHLEGSVQRAAVAPFDGYVGEATIRAGDIVDQGTVLCALDTRELELELNRWQTERDKLSKQKRQALAETDAVQIRVISAEMDQVEARRAMIEYKLERTELVSPLHGVVVTGDLSQRIGSPVERGEILFEIAPLDSYRLILEVDESDIDQIVTSQSGTVVLSALPGESVQFTVVNITPVSVPRDGRNYFRVEAQIPQTAVNGLRPGMEGLGKIEIGRRKFAWLWTHDLFDWARLGLWSWLP